MIPTSNQDGHQAKNRKRGGMKLKKIFSSETTEPISTQNFILIEQMVSDKKIFMGISHRVLC
jgi:hypothetical protein